MMQNKPVKVCFTGKNTAGSWIMRGEQIASQRKNWEALNHTKIKKSDIDRFDIFCFVKRPMPDLIEKILSKNKIVVFDIIDSWGQPLDSQKIQTMDQVIDYFAEKWKGVKAHSFIFPNKTMYQELSHLTKHSTYIYHHYYADAEVLPLREVPKKIGYEGNTRYIQEWVPVIKKVAKKFGMEFVENPKNYTDLDIVFAGRSNPYDNLLERKYKSNVKLANMYGHGIPALVSANDYSYHETDHGQVHFFADETQLEKQLEKLISIENRQKIRANFLKHREIYSLENIANYYEHYFKYLNSAQEVQQLRI